MFGRHDINISIHSSYNQDYPELVEHPAYTIYLCSITHILQDYKGLNICDRMKNIFSLP